MQLLTDDLKEKYDLEKETLPDGRIKIMLTPKHINCHGCSSTIEFAGRTCLYGQIKTTTKEKRDSVGRANLN